MGGEDIQHLIIYCQIVIAVCDLRKVGSLMLHIWKHFFVERNIVAVFDRQHGVHFPTSCIPQLPHKQYKDTLCCKWEIERLQFVIRSVSFWTTDSGVGKIHYTVSSVRGIYCKMPTCLVMKRSSGRLSGGGENLQSFNDYLSLESDWGEVSSHAKFFSQLQNACLKKFFTKKVFCFVLIFFPNEEIMYTPSTQSLLIFNKPTLGCF